MHRNKTQRSYCRHSLELSGRASRERADAVYLYWQHERALPRGWSSAVARGPPRPPETHLDGDLMGPWLLGSQPECRPLLMVSPWRYIPSSENWSRHAGSCLSSFLSVRLIWGGRRLVSPSQPPALITTSLASKPQVNMWSIQIKPSAFSEWANTGIDWWRQDFQSFLRPPAKKLHCVITLQKSFSSVFLSCFPGQTSNDS